MKLIASSRTLLMLLCLLLGTSFAWGDSYTITFKKSGPQTGDGTLITTDTSCADIVETGAEYLSGNVVTAANVYHTGSYGLKVGKSDGNGTIKMNLSDAGKVTPTSIIVSARRYNKENATRIQLNGSSTQELTGEFQDYTFDITTPIEYLEIKSSKGTDGKPYAWVESITVNYGESGSTPEPTETGEINFVAKADDGKYYATFSNERAVRFKDSFVNTAETCHAQITAYTVTVSEGQITKTGLTSDNNNYIYIPANTGVLLEYSQEENSKFEGAVPFEYADAEEENLVPESNMLVPCTKDDIYDATDTDNLYYKLAYGDNVNKTNLGFYWGAADGSGNFKVRKGIAILRVPKSVATMPNMGFIFDIHGDVNAIEAVESMNSSDVIYNLQGVRLNRIQKGVNIVNGRKVIR